MAYHIHDGPQLARPRRGVSWEYRIYFTAILLLVAIPTAVPKWTVGLLHSGAVPNPGLMQRALSETRIITTTIFSA
jgi:PufQ cytochrome subunit